MVDAPRESKNLTGNPEHPTEQDTASKLVRAYNTGLATNHIEDPVNVERGVYQKGGFEDIRPEITSGIGLDAVPWQRKPPLRWILDVFLDVPRVLAFLVLLVEVFQECLAMAGELKVHHELSEGLNRLESEDVFVFVNEVYGRDLGLNNVPPNHS